MGKHGNQKGFSLVELIVVIAIMVVLMGVMAPAFSKFIERGKKSVDVQNVDSIVEAVAMYASDPLVDDFLVDAATVTLNTGNAAVSESNCTGNADKALKAAGIEEIGFRSRKWGSDVVLTFTLTEDGLIKVTESGGNLSDSLSLLNGKYE